MPRSKLHLKWVKSMFLIGLLFANFFVFNLLASRVSARIDLTAGQLFALSDNGKKFLNAFDKKVKVYFFSSVLGTGRHPINVSYEKRVGAILKEMLFRMQKINPAIEFEEVNAYRNQARYHDLASRYKIPNDPGFPIAVMIVNLDEENRRQFLSWPQLVQFEGLDGKFYRGGLIAGIKSLSIESALFSAFGRVTSLYAEPVHFLSGHGEAGLFDYKKGGLSRLKATLERAGYLPKEISLKGRSEIPETVSTLIIINPSKLFSDLDANKIFRWLADGGRLLIAYSGRDNQALDGVQHLLKPYGLELHRDLVLQFTSIDGDGNAKLLDKAPECILLAKGRSLISRELPKKEFLTLGAPRSLEWKSKNMKREGVFSVPLYYAPRNAYGETDRISFLEKSKAQIKFSEDNIANSSAGGLELARFFIRRDDKNAQTTETFLIVFGDGGFLTDAYLGTGANEVLAKNLLASLTQKKLNIEIKPRPVREFKARLSPGQLSLVKWIFVFGFPLLLGITGIGVYMSRRLS